MQFDVAQAHAGFRVVDQLGKRGGENAPGNAVGNVQVDVVIDPPGLQPVVDGVFLLDAVVVHRAVGGLGGAHFGNRAQVGQLGQQFNVVFEQPVVDGVLFVACDFRLPLLRFQVLDIAADVFQFVGILLVGLGFFVGRPQPVLDHMLVGFVFVETGTAPLGSGGQLKKRLRFDDGHGVSVTLGASPSGAAPRSSCLCRPTLGRRCAPRSTPPAPDSSSA